MTTNKLLIIVATLCFTMVACGGDGGGAEATIAAQNTRIAELTRSTQSAEAVEEKTEPSAPMAEEVKPPTPTTLPSRPITAEPNLELYVQGIRREPIGNGLQRVTVMLSGKNASSAWNSYSLEHWSSYGSQCVWALGHEFGDSIDTEKGNPSLHTEEGYVYAALTNRGLECGRRYTSDIPPGLVFTAIGQTFSTAQPFGWIFFETAEGVSPVSITVPYQSGLPVFTEPFGMKSTTIDIAAPYDGPMPFDPAYSGNVYHPGETIEIGEAATVVVGTPLLNQGSVTIPLTVSSLNRGYPLKFRLLGGFFISLLNEAGVLCCGAELGYGLDPYSRELVQIGPLQSWEVRPVLEDILAGKYWLVGAIALNEVSPAETETKSTWVVELDVSETTSSLTVIDPTPTSIVDTSRIVSDAPVDDRVEYALNEIRSANVTIDFSAYGSELYALSDSPNLVEADLRHYGTLDVNFDASGSRADLSIGTDDSISMFGLTEAEEWRIGLHPRVTYNLDLNLGVGESTIDLSRLTLSGGRINVGVSAAEVRLPESGRFILRIGGGVGELRIRAPRSLALRAEVDTGIGSFNAGSRLRSIGEDIYESDGFGTAENAITLIIDVGIGSITIQDE